MLPGDRLRKIENPNVHGTQQLIGSLGTALSLGHNGPTQCTIGTQDFSEDFGNNKFRKWLTSDFSHTDRVHKIGRRNLQDSHSAILLQEHNFRRMHDRINGSELRRGKNIFVRAVEKRGFHLRQWFEHTYYFF